MNLLFENKQGRIEREALMTYLNELWHHTAHDGTIVNVTPVTKDPLWLLQWWQFLVCECDVDTTLRIICFRNCVDYGSEDETAYNVTVCE